MNNADQYLDFAKTLAKEAGDTILANFLAGSKREWKSDTTPVTVTDAQVNKLVIERITKKFSDHGVLGEEESHNLGSKMTWVCDPLDGTMQFSHGIQISTFSIALTEDGEPVIGVVYDPFIKRLFWAAKGKGAFLNGKKIAVSENQSLKNSLIDIEGFPSSTKPVIVTNHDFVRKLNKLGAHTTALWSNILPSALVAAGEYTAVIFNVSKPEDGAAIKVLVEEAGGKVTDLFGNDQRYDGPTKGYIASNGKVHSQLVDALSRL